MLFRRVVATKCQFSFRKIRAQWCRSSSSAISKMIQWQSMPDKKGALGEISPFCGQAFAPKKDLQMVDLLIRENPKDIFQFNLLLRKHQREGRYFTAILLCPWMSLRGVSPDKYTYGILMDCICRVGWLEMGFGILAAMLKSCFLPSVVILNSLLHGLCTSRRVADAVKVFERMPSLGCSCDVVTNGILIKFCCDMKCVDLGLGMLSYMMKQGCEPSLVAFNSLLHGLSATRAADVGMLIKIMICSGCYPDVVTYGTLINLCSDNGQVEVGCGFLSVMLKHGYQLNATILNSLIKGMCRLDKIEGATMMVRKMLDLQHLPDTVTYNILVKYHCTAGYINKAFELYEEMKMRGICCQPNVVTYNILMDNCCKVGLWDEALMFFAEMFDLGILPSVVTFGTLMNCLCKEGKVEEAHGHFCAMVGREIKPSTISCNILIQGYCMSGHVEYARELLQVLKANGFQPDLYSYAILMMGYCRSQKFADAMHLLREIQGNGLKCDVVIYNTILGGLLGACLVDDVRRVLDEMASQDVYPNTITYNILILGLCKCGEWREARKIFDGMIKHRIQPDVRTFNILIGDCCKRGHLEKALRLLELMSSFDVQPDIVSYNSIMNGYCSLGKVDVATEIFSSLSSVGIQCDSVSLSILKKGICRNRLFSSRCQRQSQNPFVPSNQKVLSPCFSIRDGEDPQIQTQCATA